ncbi:MAG: MnmC family methyltransferase [Pseudomonadota bacterium]|nr:MnmC family methyltransferase [Pseudomonadota bacterium]
MSNPLVRTNDGSTSLNDPISGQTMHAREGAFSETLYIYGKNMELAIERNYPLKMCVMGLGLGYIELISLAMILKSARRNESVALLSFEKSTQLKSSFLSWLVNDPKPNEFAKTYDEILSHIETHLNVQSSVLKNFALKLYQQNNWIFFADPLLDLSYNDLGEYHVIQFDPYSKSANPELWQQEWLVNFLKSMAGTPCSFATYASNGSLKKALSQSGFSLIEKPGFGSKRESTFAVRASK